MQRFPFSLRGGIFVLAVLAVMVVSPHAQAEEGDLNDAEFEKLHEQLAPQTQDDWRLLPWHNSVVDAVRRATKEKRPVYMLVRSGHPLGCV